MWKYRSGCTCVKCEVHRHALAEGEKKACPVCGHDAGLPTHRRDAYSEGGFGSKCECWDCLLAEAARLNKALVTESTDKPTVGRLMEVDVDLAQIDRLAARALPVVMDWYGFHSDAGGKKRASLQAYEWVDAMMAERARRRGK